MKVARGEFEEDEFMTISVTLRIIVSYDVDSRQNVEATAIYRFIHGREVTMRIEGGRRKYRYPGIMSRPGMDEVGQSVLLMRERDAEDFTALLLTLKVPFTVRKVWQREIDLAWKKAKRNRVVL